MVKIIASKSKAALDKEKINMKIQLDSSEERLIKHYFWSRKPKKKDSLM